MKTLLSLILLAGLFGACSNKSNMNDNMMGMTNDKAAKNEARMQAFYDQVMNAHNIAMLDSFTTNDFVDHNPDMGHSGKGIDDAKASFKDFFTAFPDVHIKTNFMVSNGDTIVAHVTMTGTNSGPMGPNMPATNKTVSIDGMDAVVIRDGKAAERWGFFDNMKMMKDLGMMPEHMNQNMANEQGKEGPMEKTGKKMDKDMQKMHMEKKK